MRERRRKFTPEFKSEAVRLVVDTSRLIAEVAREIGVHEGTLGNWVNTYRAEHALDEPPLPLPEQARPRELERENRELRMKTEFPGRQPPFFPRSIGERQVLVHRRGKGRLPDRENVLVAEGFDLGL